MKRMICVLLAAVMLWSVSAFAEETDIIIDDDIFIDDEFIDDDGFYMDESGDEELVLTPYDYNSITVGNPTPLDGKFFTPMFGNATSDTDVRLLLNDYSLVTWDTELGVFRFNRSVVSGAMVSDDANGNRNYMLALYDDLYFSDGTPITAQDYAFSILFQCDPAIAELGGIPLTYDYLIGSEDYLQRKELYFKGVRAVTDRIILLSVKAQELPYFYELARLNIHPYPISAIAPGYTVKDDGKGVYLAKEDTGEPSMLPAELLSKTVMDPENGYLSHPDPVSGPYRLISYDGVSAKFEINPYYKGNEEGIKPRIQFLTYTGAENETMIDDLREGKYALLNKVALSDTILQGLEMISEYPQYTQSAYPRIGLTYIYFNPTSPAVQEQNVRQAIAHCLDKPSFIERTVSSFGLETNGLMGLGQWMYQLAVGTATYTPNYPQNPTPEEEAEYNRILAELENISLDSLHQYPCDPDAANILLDEAGWTLNEQGTDYDPSSDSFRCKMVDGELVKLNLTLAYPASEKTEAVLKENLTDYLQKAGIAVTLIPIQLPQLVESHNEHVIVDADLLYLGDNFNISFDPTAFFQESDGDHQDEELAFSLPAVHSEMNALARNMARTEPNDIAGYMQKWLFFQQQLSDYLPLLPVYIDVYFDFYTRELHNYLIEQNIAWATAIVPARMYGLKSVEMEAEVLRTDDEGNVDIMAYLGKTTEKTKTDYSRGALSMFPAEIQEQIPPEYSVINEIVTSTLKADVDNIEAVTIKFTFQSVYPEDAMVYVLFGVLSDGAVEWYLAEGYSQADGSVSVYMEHDLLEALNGKTYALVVVSE